LIRHSVEDAIAAKNYEIMEVRPDPELRDLRLRDDYTFFASVLAQLCFDVAESTRD